MDVVQSISNTVCDVNGQKYAFAHRPLSWRPSDKPAINFGELTHSGRRFQQFQKTFIQSYPFLQTSTKLVSFCYWYACRHLKMPITFGLGCKTTYQNSRNGEIITLIRWVKRVKFMGTWVQKNDGSDRLTACGKAAGVASNFSANWAK